MHAKTTSCNKPFTIYFFPTFSLERFRDSFWSENLSRVRKTTCSTTVLSFRDIRRDVSMLEFDADRASIIRRFVGRTVRGICRLLHLFAFSYCHQFISTLSLSLFRIFASITANVTQASSIDCTRDTSPFRTACTFWYALVFLVRFGIFCTQWCF